jgi:diguanylate cyclase (GGDEF)-like protein
VNVPAKRRLSGTRRMRGFGRAAVLLAAIWALGLIAVAAVVGFGSRVDDSRHAQVVIAQLQLEGNALVQIAFNPATSGKSHTPLPAETVRQLRQAEGAINGSLKTLASLDHSDEPARIAILTRRNFRAAEHLSVLVATGHSGQAALLLGASNRPGGVEAKLNLELSHANIGEGQAAANSRTVASIGTILAILFLLIAFSVVFHDAVRARRRSHLDATTDALTGLGNRRKLVADIEPAIQSLGAGESMEIGIFDLNGFKTYNDTFGHPAGDALLARLGIRLAAVVGSCGRAYRIGGDEFVVVSATADGERMLAAAQEALSERTDTFAIGCSRGSTCITADTTFEDALRIADQRLYANKRSASGERRSA